MHASHFLASNAGIIRRYLAGEEMLTAGIPLIGAGDMTAGANEGGVQKMSAAGARAEAVVGLLLDTTTNYPGDKDGQVNADDDVLVTLVVNSDAVYKAKLAQSTTSDVALTAVTATADAQGDGGMSGIVAGNAVWFLTGANVGGYPRRAADTTTVAISFANAIAAGDTFTTAAGFAGVGSDEGQFDLTTDLTQIDASTVVADGNFLIVDFDVKDAGDDGVNNSHYLILPVDHMYGGNAQI